MNHKSIENFKIKDGKLISVEICRNEIFTDSNGKSYSGLPERMLVKFKLSPAKNSNINVELWLPEEKKWNGRLMGLGNGGAAGGIGQSIFADPVKRGFAAVTTDMGTAPNPDSGIGNSEVWKDFGFRATHLMTVTAKEMIKAFYGKEASFSYFAGSSTGGQQAIQEAQKYPEDYDGILAGISANYRTALHAYFLWNAQILSKCPFTEIQQKNIIDAANEFMSEREIPQCAGKLVSDPRCSSADIETVIKLAMHRDKTLTDKHAEALRKLLGGPRHAITGKRIFNGIPLGASFEGSCQNLYIFSWVFGAEQDIMKLDFGKDFDHYTAVLGPLLNAGSPELEAFKKRGGKILMYSGSADSIVPYHAGIDYFENVIEHFGSLEKTFDFFKFYIMPGMGHGLNAGGPGINKRSDMLDLLINWRENKNIPDMINVKRIVDDKIEMDFPIYPYPFKTAWSHEKGFSPIKGSRGGIEYIDKSFI